MATIFTKIINREIPATIVFENDKVIAFKDINPAAPVHILVVPKKEIPTINDIKPEDKDIIGEIYLAIGDPHMFDISAVLGKEETLRRIRRAVEVLK